jgi:predicted metal-dependent RNase
VILTHGEDGPRRELAKKIREKFGFKSTLPVMQEAVEL